MNSDYCARKTMHRNHTDISICEIYICVRRQAVTPNSEKQRPSHSSIPVKLSMRAKPQLLFEHNCLREANKSTEAFPG
jgi:hypothetical protein